MGSQCIIIGTYRPMLLCLGSYRRLNNLLVSGGIWCGIWCGIVIINKKNMGKMDDHDIKVQSLSSFGRWTSRSCGRGWIDGFLLLFSSLLHLYPILQFNTRYTSSFVYRSGRLVSTSSIYPTHFLPNLPIIRTWLAGVRYQDETCTAPT